MARRTTAITTALGSAYSYNGSAGKFTVKAANAVPNATLGLTDSTSYEAYLMIFDTATVTDSSNFYLTPTKTLETFGGTETASVKFGTQKTASQNSANWASSSGGGGADGPEPTSGLLLLVGAGILGLRRKRA